MSELIDFLKQNNILYKTDEPMKLHTTFKTGGNAELFIMPEGEAELSLILKKCRELGSEPFVIGNGSNLLVSDEGIRRPVIHIGKGFDYIKSHEDNIIEVGAGTNLSALCKYALASGLSGLEFAYGIPGSCGGAAVMNAGAYGGEMKDVLFKCRHISLDGDAGEFFGEQLDLSYRHSAYSAPGKIVTALFVKLEPGEKAEIEARMKELIGRRIDKQPLDYPSAGSVFKRPEGYFAGALVEQCGLKGKRIGGAMVSPKHAGFIINYENATTTDVVELIEFCRKTVAEKFGVELEPEIRTVS